MPLSVLIKPGAGRVIGPTNQARICFQHASRPANAYSKVSGRSLTSLAGNYKPSKFAAHYIYTSTLPSSLAHRATSCMTKYLTTRMKGTCAHKKFCSDIEALYYGNKEYMASMSETKPGLLASLALEGQKPPFMFVDCSDSRVNEQDIFSVQPGTMFTAGNIANRFDEDDINSNAVLSFAVETLRVKHVVVLGHYGCGGVAESMKPLLEQPISPANLAVQGWIRPIREIYQTSTRPEIVTHREQHRLKPLKSLPALHDPAFRALVEENVKSNVQKIANSAVIRDHYANVVTTNGSSQPEDASSGEIFSPLLPFVNTKRNTTATTITEVFIHGWVYDVETGKVSDLGVSVGPPGRAVPPSPFPLLRA